MNAPIVFMFSGQGSQYYQMGAGLYAANAVFRAALNDIDLEVEKRFGRSVVSELYDSRNSKTKEFDDFALSSAALYMVEVALARTLIEAGVRPDLTFGASMGSFAAATISGAITVREALEGVISQAELVECSGARGGMIAVLASPQDVASALHGIEMEFAAFHFDGHVVVSAPADALEAVQSTLSRRKYIHHKLSVNHPFHSRWIDPLEVKLGGIVPAGRRRKANPLLVSCAHDATLKELPDDFFWTVARRPIDFHGTLRRLEETGPHAYVNLGPTETLANFARYLVEQGSGSQVLTCLTPFGDDVTGLNSVLTALSGLQGKAACGSVAEAGGTWVT
ncbi:MAG: acyltransferase domain-containing protein [Proteobacteria bacterium]|nr:acyltransferase domain-containing protein [Pseudomonadota bacterium]